METISLMSKQVFEQRAVKVADLNLVRIYSLLYAFEIVRKLEHSQPIIKLKQRTLVYIVCIQFCEQMFSEWKISKARIDNRKLNLLSLFAQNIIQDMAGEMCIFVFPIFTDYNNKQYLLSINKVKPTIIQVFIILLLWREKREMEVNNNVNKMK